MAATGPISGITAQHSGRGAAVPAVDEALASLKALEPKKSDTQAAEATFAKVQAALTTPAAFDPTSRASLAKLQAMYDGVTKTLGFSGDLQPASVGDRLLCRDLDNLLAWSGKNGIDQTKLITRALDRVRELLKSPSTPNEDAAFALLGRVVKVTGRWSPPNP